MVVEVYDLNNFKYISYDEIKNLYLIDEYGNIYSKHCKKILSSTEDKDGYLKISLQTNNKRKTYHVHTLVMNVFNGTPSLQIKDPTIDHIDGNKQNNFYKNLRWIERSDNSSIRNIKPKGELNGCAILTEKDVLNICELIKTGDKSLSEIGELFMVDKTTISNIKRKKTWKRITENYSFDIQKQRNKEQSLLQRKEILDLLKNGFLPKDIVKMGYTKSVVYRCKRQFGTTGSK